MKNNLETILADFEGYVARCITDNLGSQKSYVSYVKSLDRVNEGQTCEWLRKAVVSEAPIKYLSDTFDEYFKNHPEITPQSQWKTGLNRLGDFICGYNHSTTNLHSVKDFDFLACNLVAQSAIFCPVEVFEMVKKASWAQKKTKVSAMPMARGTIANIKEQGIFKKEEISVTM